MIEPIEISIDESCLGVQGLVTADLWGEDISCRASFTGDRLMLETRILPLLVLDIMEEFIDDIPEVSTELAGL